MATRIQIRRDTATNWSSANTVLAQGEMALETDTMKMKVGDGTTAWGALDYTLDPVGATGRVTGADASNVSTKLYSPTANVIFEPGTGGTVVSNGNMTVNGTFNASDMGTYVGSVITDNTSLTNALQQLETAVESAEESSEFATLAGVTAGDTHLGTFTGTTISDNGSVKAGMQELETKVETKADTSALPTQATLSVDHLITLSGMSESSDDLGTFSGSTIADSSDVKTALQALETAVEGAEESTNIATNQDNINDLNSALGTTLGDTNIGNFSGSTISDGGTVKAGMQELETSLETKTSATQASLGVDHLITLSGVAEGSDNLGTFSGSTVADNGTVKAGMQSLETAVEARATTASLSAVATSGAYSDVTGTPTLATVATSGSYADLANQPTSFADLTITGNLVVQGAQTTLDTATLDVEDINITVAKDSPNAASSNGAGLTVDGPTTNATILYNDNPEKWVFNKAPYYDSNRLLTTADEGTGNGLDADTLDGQEGSHYLDYGNFTNTPTIPSTSSLNIDDIHTLTGRPDGATHMGTFTGSTINDNVTIYSALQALETAVELAEESTNISGIYTGVLGVSDGDANLGTFTGSTIADSRQVKDALQDLETKVETKLDSSAHTKASLDVDHIINTMGTGAVNDDMGTFSGSTISDNQTIKQAIQELETAVESAEETSAINAVYTGALGLSAGDAHFGAFSGSTITDNRDAKEAIQELETAVETKLASADIPTKASLDVDHLITLSGVSAASDDLGTFTGSTISDNSTIKASLQALETAVESAEESQADLDIDHLVTLTGMASGSDHLSTFTGTTINDNVTIQAALQALETAVENAEETTAINSVYTGALGLSSGDSHFGTFTGSTIADNRKAKQALQDLETAVETKTSATQASLHVDHIITLSGVAQASDDLGTFSGSTIADNETIKGALQDLETALELAEETSDINTVYTGALGLSAGASHYGTFTGSTITDNGDSKEIFQELETAVETKLATSAHTKASLDVDHLITLSGVADASDNLGTFTGSTIADSETIKGALQDLETELETKTGATQASLHVDHIITLSGVAQASDNLGAFSGATIADNETIKGALQDLETALELNATLASDETITGNYTFDELIVGVGMKSSSSDSKISIGATSNEGSQNIIMSAGENIHFLSDRNANDGDGSICFHFNDTHNTSLAVADSFWKMDESGRFGGKDATSHFEFPSWTSTERDNGSFGAGAVIFNSTTSKLQVYDGSNWVDLH